MKKLLPIILLLSLLLSGLIQKTLAQDDALIVPNVIGMGLPEAVALLDQNGIQINHVAVEHWQTNSDTPLNQIVNQSLAPESPVTSGSAIILTVVRQPNALLIFDDNDLTLVNRTGSSLDLSGITFRGEETSFAATRWVDTLRENQCAQVWSTSRTAPKGLPECEFIQSWLVSTDPTEHFWINNTPSFTIWQDNLYQQTCDISAGRCELFLENLSVSEEIADYVYFAYTHQDLRIHNISPNQWMSVANLTFLGSTTDTLNLGDLFGNQNPNRIAPNQCLVVQSPMVGEPHQGCFAIASVGVSTQFVFWSEGFDIQTANRTYTCPAPLADQITICIMPQR